MNRRPSKHQREILELLADGGVLEEREQRGASSITDLRHEGVFKLWRIRPDTMTILICEHWVERWDQEIAEARGSAEAWLRARQRWHISDAGELALRPKDGRRSYNWQPGERERRRQRRARADRRRGLELIDGGRA